MKVSIEKWRNSIIHQRLFWAFPGLNESPSKKEGKFWSLMVRTRFLTRLNESPSGKEGKLHPASRTGNTWGPQ